MSVNIYDSNTGQLQKIAGLLENENIGVPKAGTYTSDTNSNADNIKALDTALVDINQAVSNVADKVSNSSDAYSDLKAYKTGDLVIYDNILYTCTQDCPAASWLVNSSCFTVDTLINVVSKLHFDIYNVIADGAGAHNAIYRGKLLGTSVTAEQYASIADGTFKDLFIGDYWIINGVTWRIAAFDYWYNVAGDNIDVHHVVIVPDEALATCQMNSTNITTGGYVGSDFYTGANGNTGRATAISAVNNAFGATHILHYNDYLINAVTDGHPSGQVWQDCTVELMSEAMVYGGKFFEPMANGTTTYSNYTVSKSQLPLFQHDHSRICNRADWWLRGVVSATNFALVGGRGRAANISASNSLGVRPAFAIRA
jgi:hypothetical protein